MTNKSTLTVRLSGALRRHVAEAVAEEAGAYENVSEYIRDLIRRDKEFTEKRRFEQLRSELQLALSQPDSSYVRLSAEDVIRGNEALG